MQFFHFLIEFIFFRSDNLDPEHEIADDDKLWSVLEAVRLKETFRSSGLGSIFKTI